MASCSGALVHDMRRSAVRTFERDRSPYRSSPPSRLSVEVVDSGAASRGESGHPTRAGGIDAQCGVTEGPWEHFPAAGGLRQAARSLESPPHALRLAPLPTGATSAFYVVASEAPSRPGTLLRAEAFTRVVPANTRVRRILYTTTRSENVPAVASAIVLAPAQLPSDPRPVIAWTHGTTGVASGCAPSVLAECSRTGLQVS